MNVDSDSEGEDVCKGKDDSKTQANENEYGLNQIGSKLNHAYHSSKKRAGKQREPSSKSKDYETARGYSTNTNTPLRK